LSNYVLANSEILPALGQFLRKSSPEPFESLAFRVQKEGFLTVVYRRNSFFFLQLY